MPYDYETDGATIYRQSFATIRAEADLARFTAEEEPVVVRMIHAAGLVGLEAHIRIAPGAVAAARDALAAGAPVLCDARMVSRGHHPAPPARRQRGDLHPARPRGAGDGAGDAHHPLRRRARALAAASRGQRRRHRQRPDRALPPPEHARGSGLPAPRRHRRLSRWASSAPPNRRPRSGPTGPPPPSSWRGGSAARRSPSPRSTPWRAARNERPSSSASASGRATRS